MSVIVFENTAKQQSGKTGESIPDANGYHQIVLGAFGIENSSKIFWSDAKVKNLFTNSSELQERVSNGELYGEWGHPKMTPGMTARDFLIKLLVMHEEQISHHIKKLELHENFKGHGGQDCLGVIGWVKPHGPRAEVLDAALRNPDMNTSFSLRSLAATKTNSMGATVKDPIKIITWDAVAEPGIRCADKYHNPAVESRSFDNVIQFTETDIISAYQSDTVKAAGNESAAHHLMDIARQVGLTEINKNLNNRVKMGDIDRIVRNPWLKW